MADEEDPLVKALPPATDYLTYLTLLEYQLTPARLPTLHRLLQDEVLTTNIGWDLVQLLLPMLPQSQECLQDVARLGNPREVILRVSDALMKLEPEEDEEDEEEVKEQAEESGKHTQRQDAKELEEKQGDIAIASDDGSEDEKRPLPRHVMQFNCLVAMLSVLHARIKTKYASRFIATSLQAALEAYTSMPTNETTTALLEFLHDLSPTKRPTLPPRGTSQSSIFRVSEASAPDPEAETHSASTSDDEGLVQKLVQFGLVELLKSYMLSLASPTDSGVSWALRLQEKLGPEEARMTSSSKTEIHAAEHLKERDMIIGKIVALSRDLGLNNEELLRIVSSPAEQQPSPLDFEELPKSPEGIPLERHGSLLLLGARFATTILFSRQDNVRIPIYPDLAVIFSNFISASEGAALEQQPQALQDALLALTVISIHEKIEEPVDDRQYEDFVLALTACSSRQSYNSLRRIPSAVVRSHPSQTARFKLIRRVLENEDLLYARESAIGWLKDEIMAMTQGEAGRNIFVDPHYFSVLFPLLFNSAELSSLSADLSSGNVVVPWLRFSQILAPPIHAGLSLYYILISSSKLREQLQLGKTYPYFRSKFLAPLKSICRAFEEDLTQNGGDGQIEASVGKDTCRIGMDRSVGILSLVIEQIEGRLSEVFDHDDDAAIQEPTADDIAKVAEIRAQTS